MGRIPILYCRNRPSGRTDRLGLVSVQDWDDLLNDIRKKLADVDRRIKSEEEEATRSGDQCIDFGIMSIHWGNVQLHEGDLTEEQMKAAKEKRGGSRNWPPRRPKTRNVIRISRSNSRSSALNWSGCAGVVKELKEAAEKKAKKK